MRYCQCRLSWWCTSKRSMLPAGTDSDFWDGVSPTSDERPSLQDTVVCNAFQGLRVGSTGNVEGHEEQEAQENWRKFKSLSEKRVQARLRAEPVPVSRMDSKLTG